MSEATPTISNLPNASRLLRLLLVLLAVLIPLGACLGYPLGEKLYTSTGAIHFIPVKPRILYDTGNNGAIPMFDEFMKSEAQHIRSPRVIDRAMVDPRWKTWRPTFPDHFAEVMSAELTSLADYELIYVSMTDPDPKAAQLGVQTIVRAYNDIFTDNATTGERNIDSKLDNLIEQMQSDVANEQNAVSTLSSMNLYHTDNLDPVYDGLLKQLQQLGDAIQQKRMYVGADLPAGEDLLQAIAAIPNPPMIGALAVRDAYQDRLDKLKADGKYAPGNPVILDTSTSLALAKEKVEKIKNDFLRRRDRAATQPDADITSLQTQYDARKLELAEIGKDRILIVEQKEKLEQDKLKLRAAQDRRQELAVERPMADRIEVWSDGTLASRPSSDTHLALAGIGGLGGAVVGFLIVFGIALARRMSRVPAAIRVESRMSSGEKL